MPSLRKVTFSNQNPLQTRNKTSLHYFYIPLLPHPHSVMSLGSQR